MNGYLLIAAAVIVASWPQIIELSKRIKLPVAPPPQEFEEQVRLARALTKAGVHVSVVLDLTPKVKL